MTSIEGTLAGRALATVMRRLQRDRLTGILTVQGEDEIIAFSLLDGNVVSADALNQSLEDGLGEVLIEEGLIDVEDFAGLVAEYQAGGGRVTELLIERSYLTREQLLGSLRRLTYRLSRQALAWKQGEYRFYQGDDVAYEAGIAPLDIDELLVRAADDLEAGGPFGSHVSRGDQVFTSVLGSSPDGPLPSAVLEENRPEAEAVYRAFDGRRSVATIATDLGLSVYTARALAAHWLECGLIEEPSKPALDADAADAAGGRPGASGPIADLGLEALLVDPLDPTELSLELELEPEATPSPQPGSGIVVPKAERKTGDVSSWPPRIMALALLAAALWVLASHSGRLLLPFPWQGGIREALDSERERLAVHKIDRATTTFFLLEGRYPEDLDQLIADRLLAPDAILDASGRRLILSAGPASYVVQKVSGREAVDGGWSGAIAGNFLLDPQFLVAEADSEPPLVLLD